MVYESDYNSPTEVPESELLTKIEFLLKWHRTTSLVRDSPQVPLSRVGRLPQSIPVQ